MEIDADKLKAHAASRGMTQAELAERAGISAATISKILSRRHALPGTMRKLAAVLGTRIDDYSVTRHEVGGAPHVLREDARPYDVMRQCAYSIVDQMILDCRGETLRIAALADHLQRLREEMRHGRESK